MLQNPHVSLTFDKVHSPLRLPRETTSEPPKIRRPQATAGGARPRKSVVEACSGRLSALGHLPLATFGHLPGIFPSESDSRLQTATLGTSLPPNASGGVCGLLGALPEAFAAWAVAWL